MSRVVVWQSSDADLLTELGALETRLHSTWAQMLSVVAEIDARNRAPGLGYGSIGIWQHWIWQHWDMAALGYGSTVELVRAITRIPRSEARARISAAADVLPGRGLNGAPIQPKLPATAAAVADAAIGAADVAVIRSILARIPPHLGADTRTEVEAELARHARTLDAGQLAILGRRILAYLDQDGHQPHDPPETRRTLRFRDRDGGYELAGWLDREATEILRSALSPLAAPRPSTDTEIDLRSTAQRDANALVTLASRALSDGELPTESGERPQAVVHHQPARPARPDRPRPPDPSAVRSTPTSPAGSPVPPGSSRWYGAPEASRWISAGPPAPCPPRSAARSSSATADAPFPDVQYRLAGATSTISCTGSTTAPPTWKTASRSAADTTDSSTTPPGKSR